MAKSNDMPELNSAKVFLTIFKRTPPNPQLFIAGNYIFPKHNACSESVQRLPA